MVPNEIAKLICLIMQLSLHLRDILPNEYGKKWS